MNKEMDFWVHKVRGNLPLILLIYCTSKCHASWFISTGNTGMYDFGRSSLICLYKRKPWLRYEQWLKHSSHTNAQVIENNLLFSNICAKIPEKIPGNSIQIGQAHVKNVVSEIKMCLFNSFHVAIITEGELTAMFTCTIWLSFLPSADQGRDKPMSLPLGIYTEWFPRSQTESEMKKTLKQLYTRHWHFQRSVAQAFLFFSLLSLTEKILRRTKNVYSIRIYLFLLFS